MYAQDVSNSLWALCMLRAHLALDGQAGKALQEGLDNERAKCIYVPSSIGHVASTLSAGRVNGQGTA
jgi:hypothetical protein